MYKHKVVLITGASRGVGALLAQYFKFSSATVIGIGRSSVRPANCDVWVPCDLENHLNIIDAVNKLSHYRIDILINNAATLTSQYATRMNVVDAERMVRTNLLAPFVVTQRVLKLMTHTEHGRVINISSMAVPLEPMGDSVYAATKAGLTTMMNVVAKEVAAAGLNVTVNTLGISAIETDMLKQLNKDKVDSVVKALPLPRYATPLDIFNVIDFFCNEHSDYITAQTIYLGGVHN